MSVILCQILINKPKEGVHRAGKSVTGTVKYSVDEPTEFKDVKLSFLGKGKCYWSETNSDDSTDNYTGTEDYIVNHINICNKKPDQPVTLCGEYQYPFEFFLPEDIPRSFKDSNGFISYTIELKFEKLALLSFNKVFTAEIPVYNYVTPKSLGPVIFGLDKKLLSIFSAKTPVVNLKAEIDKTCLMPGENANITYTVNNNSDVNIISVRADLYCHMTYTANCGRKKYLSDKVKGCKVETTSIAERSMFKYACILPTQPELYSIENSKVIKKEYRVRVTVRLPTPHINATVEMPVIIGEQKGSTEPAVEIIEEGEQPPSYFEVMCKEENVKTSE